VRNSGTSGNGKTRTCSRQATSATTERAGTSWLRANSRKSIRWTCSKTLSSMRPREDGQLRKSAATNSSLAVNKAVKRILSGKTQKEQGGVVWATQVSGKSLTILCLSSNCDASRNCATPPRHRDGPHRLGRTNHKHVLSLRTPEPETCRKCLGSVCLALDCDRRNYHDDHPNVPRPRRRRG
jgi:hypothetical protein